MTQTVPGTGRVARVIGYPIVGTGFGGYGIFWVDPAKTWVKISS